MPFSYMGGFGEWDESWIDGVTVLMQLMQLRWQYADYLVETTILPP